MKNNSTVDTAKNGQTTNKIDTEKVTATKKTKVPTGKVVNMKETEARRKAREDAYKAFRINALRRRCARMKLSDEETESLVQKLIKQMNEPTTYQILVLFKKKDKKMIGEMLTNNKIEHHILGDYFTWIDGDTEVLKKLREILPTGTTIHPYAKKKPPILERKIPDKEKKPTSNTAAVKKAAKTRRKLNNKKLFDSRKKSVGKAAAKANKRKMLLELKAKRKAKAMQMVNKAPSKVINKKFKKAA